MATGLFSSANWVKVENNVGYGPLPIPSPRDAQIAGLPYEWMKLDSAEREASLVQVRPEYWQTLLAYSERMASLAVRETSREHLHLGLLALGLDGWRGDWRENLLVLCLHFDAAKRIGVSPDDVFEEAAMLLPPRLAEGLRAFLRRTPENQSLEVMGYVTGSDSDGFRYVRTW